MLPVSAAYLAAIRSSHQMVARAIVLTTPGDEGADVAGTALTVIGGNVNLDSTADVRGTLELTVKATWPRGPAFTTGDLVPYGTEIAVSRGVVFGNGDIERAPLGIYRLETCSQDDAPKGTIQLQGKDRMAGIIDAKLLFPVQYLASQTHGGVVNDLVLSVYPGLTIEWDDATNVQSIGRDVIVEEDRFAFLKDLITSVGKVFYFDYRGVLVIKTAPDPAVPVWDVDAGARGVLVRASRERSRDGVYNAVVATGEALDDAPPVVGYAFDGDPASVTYWGGAFGQVPRRYSSPFITTVAQAESAAAGILQQSLGLPYEVNLAAVPNAALEPLDSVRVIYPPELGQAPVTYRETHVVDRLTIPLDAAGVMAAGTRLQTYRATIATTEP